MKKQLHYTRDRHTSIKKRLFMAHKTSTLLTEIDSKMTPVVANFMKCQLRNVNRKPKGSRFTLEDKLMAIALFKQSGKSYRLLSQMFSLPSRKTMMTLLNRIVLKPGINNILFNHLEKIAQTLRTKEKYCVLLFDEIALSPNLHWNVSLDIIEGFEDNGYERTLKVADHAQVFMLRGIFKKWKQPICYSFCEGTTKSASLVRSIKDIVRAVHKSGLHILATVCDQGTTNASAIRTLITDTKANYLRSGKLFDKEVFDIDGEEIIPIYDPPHLLKGIRNNLLTKDIAYINEAGTKCIATWNDVIKAYKIDAPSARLRLLRKITDFHVLPSKIKKMKVSYCTQVFSKQYAATITRMSHDSEFDLFFIM